MMVTFGNQVLACCCGVMCLIQMGKRTWKREGPLGSESYLVRMGLVSHPPCPAT